MPGMPLGQALQIASSGYMSDDTADHLEIGMVVARCNMAFDREDEAAWLSCWAPNAIFHVNGKTAESTEQKLEIFRSAGRPIHHVTANSIVELDGDTAKHECSLVVFGTGAEGAFVRVHGYYDDSFVRTADGWQISKRTVNLIRYSP